MINAPTFDTFKLLLDYLWLGCPAFDADCRILDLVESVNELILGRCSELF